MSSTLIQVLKEAAGKLTAGKAVENQFHYTEKGMMRRRILALRADGDTKHLMNSHDSQPIYHQPPMPRPMPPHRSTKV